MKRLALLALVAVCFLLLPACCGGQPTMSVGLPTLQFGQNTSTPTQSVPVPMVPAYSVQAAPTYSAPCAPVQSPTHANPCP